MSFHERYSLSELNERSADKKYTVIIENAAAVPTLTPLLSFSKSESRFSKPNKV